MRVSVQRGPSGHNLTNSTKWCPPIVICAPEVRHWSEVRGLMAKFSLKFKQEVAEKYLEGELSLEVVAKMYNLCPKSVRK